MGAAIAAGALTFFTFGASDAAGALTEAGIAAEAAAADAAMTAELYASAEVAVLEEAAAIVEEAAASLVTVSEVRIFRPGAGQSLSGPASAQLASYDAPAPPGRR